MALCGCILTRNQLHQNVGCPCQPCHNKLSHYCRHTPSSLACCSIWKADSLFATNKCLDSTWCCSLRSCRDFGSVTQWPSTINHRRRFLITSVMTSAASYYLQLSDPKKAEFCQNPVARHPIRYVASFRIPVVLPYCCSPFSCLTVGICALICLWSCSGTP